MAGESPTSKSNGGEGSKSSRRRSFRSKRRARKPVETGIPAKGEIAAPQPAAPAKAEAPKEPRERRRRRRNKSRSQTDSRPTPIYEDNVSDLPPLRPAFVYTHVIRPDARDSYEFRSDHFSKVTRRLEDFNIDLTPLWRAQEEAAKPFKFVMSPDLAAEWDDEEAWEEEPEAAADAGTTEDDEQPERGPSAGDDHEAALREARRRRRARRAKARAGRRERPDGGAPAA